MPSARCSSSSRRARVVLVGPGERRGPVAHLDGEQQLPAPGRVQDLDGDDRPLIGDGEAAQLADLVAPELDAHGVLGRGREDVDDPAADGELAARGDHLDPRVRQLDEPDQQVVEVVLSPTRSVTGSSRPRPGAIGWIRLRAAATTSRGAVAGSARLRKIDNRRPTVSGRGDSRSCGSVSQLGSTATASRPSRSADGAAQILGLPVGGGDGEHGATAVGEGGGQERPQCRGALDGQRRDAGGAQVAGCGGEGAEFGVRGRGADRRAWPRFPLQLSAQQDRPLPGTDGGLPPGYARRSPRVGTFAGASRHVRGASRRPSPDGNTRSGRRQHGRPSLSATHEQVRRA